MTKINLNNWEAFENRHNSPNQKDLQEMLQTIGVNSLEDLISETIPQGIRLTKEMNLPKGKTEFEFLQDLRKIASKNEVFRSYIGLGYSETITPNVILRNILENPGWYTAYTPYQAEISQGRLEMLLNFQTMVLDLTGMEITNASLLDEATAAAEAMRMFWVSRKKDKKTATQFFVSEECHPQTIELLKGRAEPLGIELIIGDFTVLENKYETCFGMLLQYPTSNGTVYSYRADIQKAKSENVKVAVAADLLALTLLTPPGEMGADVVLGNTQRFGVPLGFGGPHAAYFACKEEYKRQIPGRIIGISKDAEGNLAYRMALQTREQHIKREKATSNICTAQVLLAVIAGAYGVYHGAEGLRNIALRIHGNTKLLALLLRKFGFDVVNGLYFDTIKVNVHNPELKAYIRQHTEEAGINLRIYEGNFVGVSIGENATTTDIKKLLRLFVDASVQYTSNSKISASSVFPSLNATGIQEQGDISLGLDRESFDTLFEEYSNSIRLEYPDELTRKSDYLTHPNFNSYQTEHEMLRYLKRLENKDLSLVHSMISLGSCTMKLNATAQMIPISWAEFSSIHPFAPKSQTLGYQQIIKELSEQLCAITGFDAVSLQPNSGAQGEFAGLMVIRAYHLAQGDTNRNIILIPSSAHGTNPASAVMAGMKVVISKCDENGNIDVNDLKEKAEKHSENLAGLMVTYPSTHGVFEEEITQLCDIIHQHGGKVYMDGANMNAQIGFTSPARIGADVCHLNLHKTFAIPHGGGGPGMGPIGVKADLAEFLPDHPITSSNDNPNAILPISSAAWGSGSILLISYAYIVLMGKEGLTNATRMAILNANYLKDRLKNHYPVLYTGKNGRAAHEFIMDCRDFKKSGIDITDVAKRLIDYGFHSPTMSFPVPGTLMIEPTESETKAELDRFCDALISIRKEIAEVENDEVDAKNNVLTNSPHPAHVLLSDNWDRPYSIEKAAYPLDYVRQSKFWVSVSRVDNAFGDRNLVCACLPIEAYQED